MTEPVRRILLIKPSSLGDIVHAMPTLFALRERFPDAEVTWLVKRQWVSLVEVIKGVDHVCAVEQGLMGWLGRVPDLRAAGFDLVVDLQGLFRSGAMAWPLPKEIGVSSARRMVSRRMTGAPTAMRSAAATAASAGCTAVSKRRPPASRPARPTISEKRVRRPIG